MKAPTGNIQGCAHRINTKRGRFLQDMDNIVPWARLVHELDTLVVHHKDALEWVEGEERMLRIYFLQYWYKLDDTALVDELHDSQAVRCFLHLSDDTVQVPSAQRVKQFRCMLAERGIGDQLIAVIDRVFHEYGLEILRGSKTDAVIVEKPPSPSDSLRVGLQHAVCSCNSIFLKNMNNSDEASQA